jgi:hypothetical protein
MTTRKIGIRDLITLVGVLVVVIALGLALAQAQSVAKDWNQFLDQALLPFWKSVVLPLVVGMAGLVVLARVWVLFGWFNVGTPLARTTRARLHEGYGVVAALALSLFLVGELVLVQPSRNGRWVVAAYVLFLALFLSHSLARWFASARDVYLEVVMGKDPDEAGAGQLVGFLEQLSAERPRGIEVARGTDVTALKEVGLTAAPSNGVAAAALVLVNLLIPRAPWRVRVDAEDADKMSVTVTRNGRVIKTATIDRDSLGLRVALPGHDRTDGGASAATNGDGGTVAYPDLHTMAAAVILTALVGEYDDIYGLYEATDWRSVGLCAIATFNFPDAKDRLPLLARAIDYDPKNRLAQAAFHHAHARRSTDADCLDQYIDWLDTEIESLDKEAQKPKDARKRFAPEWSPYRRRLKMNRAVASVNKSYLEGVNPTEHERDREKARKYAFDLVDDIFCEDPRLKIVEGELSLSGVVKGTEDACRVAFSMWPSAAATYAATCLRTGQQVDVKIGGEYIREAEQQIISEKQRLGTLDAYNRACYFATADGKDRDEAVKMLRISDEVPYLKEWRQKDPQLHEFRLTSLYRTKFLADPAEVLSYLEPFSAHKENLAAAGLDRDPTKFHRLAEKEPFRIARLLGVDILVVRRLSEIADMAAKLLEKSRKYGIEVCAQLIAEGIDSLSSPRPEGLLKTVDRALQNRLKESPSEDEFSELLSVSEPTS